jgi:hypothetical protein
MASRHAAPRIRLEIHVESDRVPCAAVPRVGARRHRTAATMAMPVPGVGWLAYVQDAAGNLVGIVAADPAAR